MTPTPLRHQSQSVSPASAAAEPTGIPDPAVLPLRAVHRAVADLRRGTPVVLAAEQSLVLLGAEAAGARGLAELHHVATGTPVLLLAPARAAAVLHRPVVPPHPAFALRLPEALFAPEYLRSLADPTLEQWLPAEPVQAPEVPEAAPAAMVLVKLSRLLPALVAAPVDAASARVEALRLGVVSAADVLAYPASMAAALTRVAEAEVPLEGAENARVVAFRAPDAGVEHLAILIGNPEQVDTPLVRLHSECFTGDLLGSLRCDCGLQLRGAIQRMGQEKAGVLLYLAQEGRSIGLVNKLRAYALQDRGLDTVDANRALGWGADERNFMIAATMLEALGVRRLRLLTNNPDKVAALVACGVDVVSREPHAFAPNGVNDLYLATKMARFGHLLG